MNTATTTFEPDGNTNPTQERKVMNLPMRRELLSAGALATLAVLAPNALAQSNAKKTQAVFQVSDADPQKWNLTLNNVNNVIQDLGTEKVDLEIVVYGPGIGMLKADSPVGKRIAEALKSGVKVVACENTMKGQNLVYANMLPEIGYVPSGVVELITKQRDGYSYIRP